MRLSVGSTGDSYDNGLAECVNGAYKSELVWCYGFFESFARLEVEIALWVAWWNRERLHQSLGYRTPVGVEEMALEKKGARVLSFV